MSERAHPEDIGFQDRLFGLIRNPYKKKLHERYKFCNKYIKNKRVLDIPCGVGWGTSLLKSASSIVGLDISKDAIAYAQQHYQNKKRCFFVGSMESIPIKDNCIDVVICLEGLEHISRESGYKFIYEVKRVLTHSGILIITCPVLDNNGFPSGNPYHVYEYPEHELIELMNNNFRILYMERDIGVDSPEYRLVVQNIKK